MILALDTSLHDLNIALFTSEGNPLEAYHHTPEPTERGVHDAMLAAKTNELLNKVDLTAKSVERIVYIAGPGSFTGLRIGLAFAKGMAYATNASLVPISSHAALQMSLEEKEQSDRSLLFAYPGYDRHSLYIAHAGAINDIALVPLHDIMPNLTIAGPQAALDLLDGKHEQTIRCAIDLHAVVEHSTHFPEVRGFDALANLEPLYITPFTPHPASQRVSG